MTTSYIKNEFREIDEYKTSYHDPIQRQAIDDIYMLCSKGGSEYDFDDLVDEFFSDIGWMDYDAVIVVSDHLFYDETPQTERPFRKIKFNSISHFMDWDDKDRSVIYSATVDRDFFGYDKICESCPNGNIWTFSTTIIDFMEMWVMDEDRYKIFYEIAPNYVAADDGEDKLAKCMDDIYSQYKFIGDAARDLIELCEHARTFCISAESSHGSMPEKYWHWLPSMSFRDTISQSYYFQESRRKYMKFTPKGIKDNYKFK
jgi:hypothetical protein